MAAAVVVVGGFPFERSLRMRCYIARGDLHFVIV